MFQKLFRNIYLPIVLIAVALILFIDVFSVMVLTDTLKDAYNSIDQKRVSRALDSGELYISSVANSVYNLSLNDALIDELEFHSQKTLTSLLDNTCNYSLKINAVCAYSVDGIIYTSSGIAQVPSLETLQQNTSIRRFIEGENDDAVSFRTEYITDIYNNAPYPDEMGVITCCRKVYDGDRVVGWIFADILPSNLYYLLYTTEQFDDAVAFITFEGGYFDYAGNSRYENLLTGAHGGYFEYRADADDGTYSFTVFNSTKDYRSRLTVLILILLAASVVLVIGVHFIALKTAKGVTKRLEKISFKMNSQELEKTSDADQTD